MKKDLIILLLLIIPAFAPLVRPGFFPMHDDLQTIRQLQMAKCFSDGQIPCRWVPDMGNGFGYPLFNYYPPLPYYLGQLFYFLGIEIVDIVKIVGILGFVLSAAFMYFLAKEFWGRSGGLLSAVFYTYAPYHSVDFYVRGAMNEFWALVFFPLILLSIYKVISLSRFNHWILILTISLSGLLLSHNPMLMIFAPVAVFWALYWLVNIKRFSSLPHLVISAIWGLGIAAFFTLPVLFEQKFVHVETLVVGYFNYLAHFADINQLIKTINWGYGGSNLGPDDGMSFALGYLHWLIPLLLVILALFIKKIRLHFGLIMVLLLTTIFALFMTHSRSSLIWSAIKPLEYLQFPWRFLAIAIFSSSLLSGLISKIHPKLTILILSLVILINAAYFMPRAWNLNQTDQVVFSDSSWNHLITGSIFDYLPKSAKMPPPNSASSDIDLIAGSGSLSTIEKRSNLQEYLLEIDSDSSVVELQTFYYPGWEYYINGTNQQPSQLDIDYGRPQFLLNKGDFVFTAKFIDTPVRLLSNYVSLISIFIFFSAALFLIKKNYGR